MRTLLLITVLGATASGGEPTVGNAQTWAFPDARQKQLLEERRDLLKAATHIPPSYGLPHDMDVSELYTYAWLNLWDAELQLARDPRKRIELCKERLASQKAHEAQIRTLYDVGARGGDRWRMLRSQCRVLRAKIALARETAGGVRSSTTLDQIAKLRSEWVKTARDYAAATPEDIKSGFVNPQLILPALAELQDAEVAVAKSIDERIAARRRHVVSLGKVEASCQNAKQQSDRQLTFLSARAQRFETELRLLNESQALGARPRAALARTKVELKRDRLKARADYLAAMQERFWEGTVWMEALLAAYRGVCDAELDLCRNKNEREATLAKWINRLATLRSQSAERSRNALRIWDAECAAERLRLAVELGRLKTVPVIGWVR